MSMDAVSIKKKKKTVKRENYKLNELSERFAFEAPANEEYAFFVSLKNIYCNKEEQIT